jgi:hypothetical protein
MRQRLETNGVCNLADSQVRIKQETFREIPVAEKMAVKLKIF